MQDLPPRPQLGRLIGLPLATIGIVAAILMWELEHAGSVAVALGVFGATVLVAAIVARRVRRQIDELSQRYEALLRTADQQSRRAEAASRVKDEFLATLSHELRTPLNSILGWTRLLAGGKLDAPQTRRAIAGIERAGWTQARMVEDLLDVSRMARGKLDLATRPVVVQPIASAAVDLVRPAADAKHVGLELRLDRVPRRIAADPDRLHQIVWNLVANAVKFTPPRGLVRIQVGGNRERVMVAVVDTGIGFGPEVAAHLFEPFRQGDASSTRPYGGLGLGLDIVRYLVEMHGGTITAQSRGENRGARFVAYFPSLAEEAAACA